jgi:hypothetical protein
MRQLLLLLLLFVPAISFSAVPVGEEKLHHVVSLNHVTVAGPGVPLGHPEARDFTVIVTSNSGGGFECSVEVLRTDGTWFSLSNFRTNTGAGYLALFNSDSGIQYHGAFLDIRLNLIFTSPNIVVFGEIFGI